MSADRLRNTHAMEAEAESHGAIAGGAPGRVGHRVLDERRPDNDMVGENTIAVAETAAAAGQIQEQRRVRNDCAGACSSTRWEPGR